MSFFFNDNNISHPISYMNLHNQTNRMRLQETAPHPPYSSAANSSNKPTATPPRASTPVSLPMDSTLPAMPPSNSSTNSKWITPIIPPMVKPFKTIANSSAVWHRHHSKQNWNTTSPNKFRMQSSMPSNASYPMTRHNPPWI